MRGILGTEIYYICIKFADNMNATQLYRLTVITLTSKHLATLHPSVPAPRSKHFVLAILSKSNSGNKRHLINFKFKSTADSANLNK